MTHSDPGGWRAPSIGTKPEAGRDPVPGLPPGRHWGGFIVSGSLAFIVDASMMEIGVRLFGLPPLVARLVGVGGAMLTGWLSHRTLTFGLTTRPNLPELARYVTAASVTSGVNYLLFALLLLGWPSMPRLGALVIASCVATIFAYVSMRYGVFRRYRDD